MERRDMVLQILVEAGGPLGETSIIERMRDLHGVHLTPQSVRMMLRGAGVRVSLVKQGPLGMASWQSAPDGRAR